MSASQAFAAAACKEQGCGVDGGGDDEMSRSGEGGGGAVDLEGSREIIEISKASGLKGLITVTEQA